MLSLLRSTRIQSYGYGGGYERGMSSDSGFELGKEFVFDYALVPHAGDWRQAGVYRDGLEFNHPLLARAVASHPGVLPKRWGFLGRHPAEHRRLRAQARRRRCRGVAALRGGRPAGKCTDSLCGPVLAAKEVNLLEDPGGKLAVADDALQLDFRPFEIKTVKLRLQH